MFELSRERYPELYIPFDKIRAVSTAYRDIGNLTGNVCHTFDDEFIF